MTSKIEAIRSRAEAATLPCSDCGSERPCLCADFLEARDELPADVKHLLAKLEEAARLLLDRDERFGEYDQDWVDDEEVKAFLAELER